MISIYRIFLSRFYFALLSCHLFCHFVGTARRWPKPEAPRVFTSFFYFIFNVTCRRRVSLVTRRVQSAFPSLALCQTLSPSLFALHPLRPWTPHPPTPTYSSMCFVRVPETFNHPRSVPPHFLVCVKEHWKKEKKEETHKNCVRCHLAGVCARARGGFVMARRSWISVTGRTNEIFCHAQHIP